MFTVEWTGIHFLNPDRTKAGVNLIMQIHSQIHSQMFIQSLESLYSSGFLRELSWIVHSIDSNHLVKAEISADRQVGRKFSWPHAARALCCRLQDFDRSHVEDSTGATMLRQIVATT